MQRPETKSTPSRPVARTRAEAGTRRRFANLRLLAAVALLALPGVCGLAAGAAWAWSTVGLGGRERGVGPYSWRSSANLGAASTDPLSRAVIARTGIWALPASEVVYFQTDRDAQGQPLRRECVYEIADRTDPPARWWSIGLYRDDRWIDNAADRYAFSSTTVGRGPGGAWRIAVAGRPQPGDWLPMGERDGRFVLSLRLYQPDPSVAKALAATPLPPIRRLSCA